MIPFRPVTLEDKPWIDRLNHASGSKSADYSFTTLFVWQGTYLPRIAQAGNRILVCSGRAPELLYAYPAGDGPLEAAMEQLMADARDRGLPFRMRGLTTGMTAQLEALYPGKFLYLPIESEFDYVYRAEVLATLAGKKLHAKRNHIHRFEEAHAWEFRPVTRDNLADCQAVCARWFAAGGETGAEAFSGEAAAIQKALAHFDVLGVEGGLLYAEGRPIAFTLGEVLSRDTYLIHFEKADGEIQGAYTMINREFARHILARHPEIQFINREEDMGLENLRKAKQSYYPEFLVKKYAAILK